MFDQKLSDFFISLALAVQKYYRQCHSMIVLFLEPSFLCEGDQGALAVRENLLALSFS